MTALTSVLVVRVGTRLGALALADVIETLRPLPLETVSGAPPFVLGVSVIRGTPIPVLDVALLLGEPAAAATRLVVVRSGERRLALAVHAVVGLKTLDAEHLRELPPLLHAVADTRLVGALGTIDDRLLTALRCSRELAAEAYGAVDTPGATT